MSAGCKEAEAMMRRNAGTPPGQGGNGAYTLVNLLVVMVIVGVLVVAAVEFLLRQIDRTKAAEALASLGAVRRLQAVYKNEHGEFLAVALGDIANLPEDEPPGLGLDFSNNAFFGNGCFSVTLDGDGYAAVAYGGGEGNDAPRAAKVTHISVWMNHKGEAVISFDGVFSEVGGGKGGNGRPDWAPGPPPWVPANSPGRP